MKLRKSTIACLLVILTTLGFGSLGGNPAQAGSLNTALISMALAAITPDRFDNGVNMPVTITGTDLTAVTTAALGAVELRNVKVTSSTQITALVPWSIEPGTYDLTVKTQTGTEAVLPGAVTIRLGSNDWASNGPYGGSLWDLVVDPVHSTHLFVAASRSGLWKTEDGGASWVFSNTFPFLGTVQISYPDPDQPPVLYVNCCMRSLDDGLTWERKAPEAYTAITQTSGAAGNLFVRPGQPDWVYFGIDPEQAVEPAAGLYLSTNRGETWSFLNSTSGLHVTALGFDPDQAGVMILGTESGQIYRSTDNGATWGTPVSVSHYIGQFKMAPTLFDGKRSFWTADTYPHDYATDTVYRSRDGGQTWNPIQILPGTQNFDLTFHDSIPGLMWAAVGGGYYSEDDGATWHAISPISPRPVEAQSFAVIPGATSRQTTTLLAATNIGMFKSSDGGSTWQPSDQGLGANLARSIAISPFNADEAYAATGSKGLLHTYNGGRSWESLPIAISYYETSIATDPFTDGRVYFGNWYGAPHVQVSSNHGLTYTEYPIQLPAPYTGQDAIVRITPDPSVPNRLLAGLCLGSRPPRPGFIYASTDGGQTWTQQSTPAGAQCITTELVFDPTNPQVVYAGSQTLGILRSTDGGATWQEVAHQPAGTTLTALAVDPRDARAIYIAAFDDGFGSESGIFATQDGGQTWVKMTGTPSPIWELRFVQVGSENWLFAGTMNGLFYLKLIPHNPETPWLPFPGVAGVAAVDGFNAASDGERTVFYIGTSGGTLPPEAGTQASQALLAPSPNFAGGIYRSMAPHATLLEKQGWHLRSMNSDIMALEPFAGYLYAGDSSWQTGGRIWRTADGEAWTPASDVGMGSEYGANNPAIIDLVTFQDHLYASVGWGETDGQIWRTGPDLQWSKVVDGEFGGSAVATPTVLIVFNNTLYAFTNGAQQMIEIWRTGSGDSGSWEHLPPDGFGNPNNQHASGAAVLNAALYVATANAVDGLQIWRTTDGAQWVQANTSGFGDATRKIPGGMAVFNGYVYVGVENTATGGEIWRSNGGGWSKVVTAGFGDSNNVTINALLVVQNRLFAITQNKKTGLQVWQTWDSTNWIPINQNGLGNQANSGVLWSNSSAYFSGNFYLGTFTGEIWQYMVTPFYPLYLPLLKK